MCLYVMFIKQKTAYEMRISDWRSDVCSSDLFTVDAPAPFAIPPFTLGEVRAPQVRDIRLEKGVHVTGKVKVPPGQPAPTELMWLDFTASIAGVYPDRKRVV